MYLKFTQPLRFVTKLKVLLLQLNLVIHQEHRENQEKLY